MKKMKAGIIGLGTFFWGHLKAYMEDENTELYSVCDESNA